MLLRVSAEDYDVDQDCYQLKTKCFAVYGFEYKPGTCQSALFAEYMLNICVRIR
jgi:hypothetical protein